MKKINYILDLNNLESEINELKLIFLGDNLSKHRVLEEDEQYTVIELTDGDKVTDGKHLFYGIKIGYNLYLGRYQQVYSIQVDPIDVYDEFYSKGEELSFN